MAIMIIIIRLATGGWGRGGHKAPSRDHKEGGRPPLSLSFFLSLSFELTDPIGRLETVHDFYNILANNYNLILHINH